MSTAYRSSAAAAGFIRREHDRSIIALPAIVALGGQDFSARVLNIAPGGAMIECSAAFPPAASFLLRCGSIAANAVVVWQKNGRYGVSFRLPLSEGQVREQQSRNEAINSRKMLKSNLNSPTDGTSTPITVPQVGDTKYDPALHAHLSAIETAHQEVESCLVVLEKIMASELSDLGQFSAARLRLRQANSARTHIALVACRHLMAVQQADHSLRDLHRRELDVSRMISEHVQRWSVQALQDDWDGYCRASKKVLEGVRELIAAEKKLLCPMLRRGAQVERLL